MLAVAATGIITQFLCASGIFPVVVSVVDAGFNDRRVVDSFVAVGFSPVPLLVLVIVVVLATAVSLWIGSWELDRGMPLATPCSAAISAACHLAEMEDGVETAQRPVRWGVVGTENSVGRLAFSAGPVGGPVPRRKYW
jgi:hypothetical protein